MNKSIYINMNDVIYFKKKRHVKNSKVRKSKNKVIKNTKSYIEKNGKNIYFLFSSITFLQFFIPLVIEFNLLNYSCVFILRENLKRYCDPYDKHNYNMLLNFAKKYKIKLIKSSIEILNKITGPVIMIDGDIYGPPRDFELKNAGLFHLNKEKTIKFNLTEHLNFLVTYYYYINEIDYAIFTNKYLIDQVKTMSNNEEKLIEVAPNFFINTELTYDSEKNVYLGNPKFDNLLSNNEIYKKYKLNPNKKYCLFLYPKKIPPKQEDKNIFNNNHLKKILLFLKKIGYTLIIKCRPKERNYVRREVQKEILISKDSYPKETLELLKISDLSVMCSSSAIDESVYTKTPCIDLETDLRNYTRNSYLLKDKLCMSLPLKKWKNMEFDEFKKFLENFVEKDSIEFVKLKNEFIFDWENSSKKIVNFIISKFEFFKNKTKLLDNCIESIIKE